MKIEIDKKSGFILVAVAAIFLAIGIGLNNNFMNHDSDEMMSGMGSNSKSGYSSSDLMFAQMMIPHHQQAITMSDLALKISKNNEVLALAAQIKAAQDPEIAQMKKWLSASGSGEMMNHNMGMDGMLSEEEMATLEKATGNNFDKLFLEGMIAHHQGAIDMLSIISNTSNSEVKQLRENIRKTQTAEIALMKTYLATLPK